MSRYEKKIERKEKEKKRIPFQVKNSFMTDGTLQSKERIKGESKE